MEQPQKITKHAGGRPKEFTDETVKKLEEAFAIDASVEEASFYAGITKQTYYNNVKEGTELFDRLDALRNRPVLKARQTVVKSLDDPNYAFRYLEKKRAKEFGGASVGTAIQINVENKIENTQIEKIRLEYESKLNETLRH